MLNRYTVKSRIEGSNPSVSARSCGEGASRRCGERPAENPLQVIVRSRSAAASRADAVDVAVVGAATAAEHVDVWKAAQQLSILAAELERVANVELGRIVELGVAAAR